MPAPKKRLGEVLIEMGAIDEMQLQSALGYQQQWGKSLGTVLVEKAFCAPEDVLRALSLQTGYPAIDLDRQELDGRLAFVLPVKSAEKHRAVPLKMEGKRQEVLLVALAGPAGLEVLDAIRSLSGKQRIVPHVALEDALERAIGRLYYGRKPTPKAPPPKPLSKVEVQGEEEFALPPEDAAAIPELLPTALPAAAVAPRQVAALEALDPPRPVLLYGWRDAVSRALAQSLQSAAIGVKVASDEELLGCVPQDIIVSNSLALEAITSPGQRLNGVLIVAGIADDEDMASAKKLGANVYLRAPLNPEQLLTQVRRCQEAAARRR